MPRTHPEGGHVGAAPLRLVRGARLAPGGFLDGRRHHRGLDLGRHPVLRVGLGLGDLGQRQLAALLVQIAEAAEAVARVAHHPTGLRHAAQLLRQLQQADLGLDHLAFGRRHGMLSGATGRGAALRLWLRAPASVPTEFRCPSDQIKTSAS
jgi:hypothetical protein